MCPPQLDMQLQQASRGGDATGAAAPKMDNRWRAISCRVSDPVLVQKQVEILISLSAVGHRAGHNLESGNEWGGKKTRSLQIGDCVASLHITRY
jgi:hypothetical protein